MTAASSPHASVARPQTFAVPAASRWHAHSCVRHRDAIEYQPLSNSIGTEKTLSVIDQIRRAMRSVLVVPLARERVTRVDPAIGAGAGSGRPALAKGRKRAIARIAPVSAAEAVARRFGGRERSDGGQDQSGGEGGEHKTAHGRTSLLSGVGGSISRNADLGRLGLQVHQPNS